MPFVASSAARKTMEPMKDRKSTRLNSSHANISYAVFGLKKKNEAHEAVIGEEIGIVEEEGAAIFAVCNSAAATLASASPVLRRFFLMMRRPPSSTLFPDTTLFR